eukprot:c9594_g1_i3.p1 GENE.c9594_g1_i3~~c9594_g1_i3.p1  ORF type:complete len:256 (-),score=17.90 c9594_g1_i3:23-790(-)
MGWGCGYRNIQMLCSHLVGSVPKTTSAQHASKLISNLGNAPSLESIQLGIENAWSNGFDRAGASQLGHKLRNTSKWIGATEVVSLLRYHGVRARIVDFDSSTCSHSEFFKWVCEYFSHTQAPTTRSTHSTPYQRFCCGRPPLYLQHQGHSRTIVGVIREWHNDEERDPVLLVFDPAIAGPSLTKALDSQRGWQRLVKRESRTFWQQQFQLVSVEHTHLHVTCTSQSHHHPVERRSRGDADLSKVIESEKIRPKPS